MNAQASTAPSPTSFKYTIVTAVAAATAAAAATTSASLGWPVWAMFMGWVAFFTRGHTAKEAFFSYLCLALGIAFGMGATLGIGALMPHIGQLAFGPVVFVVAMIVVSLRAVPLINNIPAYFLGLITFFAAHLPPSILDFSELAAVSAIGTFAAWVAHRVQGKIAAR